MWITVVYALPEKQILEQLELADGSTARQAIELSRILEIHPEVDLKINKIGVFSKVIKLDAVVYDGDRIEIYRTLPKKSRSPYAKEKKKIATPLKNDGN
ncbi:MAG: RnfH family protein [Mariprofundaceae bacterium]|nr:RnfH family protein [Mariprofundaceae bacterium]